LGAHLLGQHDTGVEGGGDTIAILEAEAFYNRVNVRSMRE
jgi:hypothetical protein